MTASRPVTVITGASVGIGAELARVFARHGHALVLLARRTERLETLAAEIAASGAPPPLVVTCDLLAPGAVEQLAQTLQQEGVEPQYLVNNAGFGAPQLFHTNRPESHFAMLQVHVVAPVRFSRAALPAMIARRKGAIIAVCSMAQYIRTPGNTMYGATKLFLDDFSQRLNLEVGAHGIEIQSLIPGYTVSNFGNTEEYRHSRRAAIPAFLWSSAESVVEASLRQLGSGRRKCVPGAFNRVLEFCVQRDLLPLRLIQRWIA